MRLPSARLLFPAAMLLYAIPAAAQTEPACPKPKVRAVQPVAVVCNGTGPDYPYDRSQLERAIALSEALMTAGKKTFESEGLKRSVGYVSVIDTGLAGAETIKPGDVKSFAPVFPQPLFNFYTQYTTGDEVYKTFGQSFADPLRLPDGIAMPSYNPTLPTPLSQFPNWQHGTHIAGIIAGQPVLQPPLNRILVDKVRINAFNAVDFIPVRSQSACSGSYELSIPFIGQGMENAHWWTAYDVQKIANLSIETQATMRLPSYVEDGSLMLVVAAGNAPINHDDPRTNKVKIYPARLAGAQSGEREPHMMVVGAHDADRKLVDGTSYGAWTVDLAAPGCKISSVVSLEGGSTLEMSGTSQATAFVSLTAALLRALYDMDVDDIRTRINDTVDLSPHLEGKVLTGGALNIAKAVAAGFDIIKLTSGEIKYGMLVDATVGFCNKQVRALYGTADSIEMRASARRFDLTRGATMTRIRLRRWNDTVSFTCPNKEIASNFVRFSHYGASGGKISEPIPYPLDQISEIIFSPLEPAIDFHASVGDIGPLGTESAMLPSLVPPAATASAR